MSKIPTLGTVDPSLSQGVASQQQALAKAKALETRSVKTEKDIDKAAGGFEALLLHQMFQAMWSTVPSGGVLSGSKEEEYFRDMFTQGLADTISQGQGIGIKQVVAREMYQRAKTDGSK